MPRDGRGCLARSAHRSRQSRCRGTSAWRTSAAVAPRASAGCLFVRRRPPGSRRPCSGAEARRSPPGAAAKRCSPARSDARQVPSSARRRSVAVRCGGGGGGVHGSFASVASRHPIDWGLTDAGTVESPATKRSSETSSSTMRPPGRRHRPPGRSGRGRRARSGSPSPRRSPCRRGLADGRSDGVVGSGREDALGAGELDGSAEALELGWRWPPSGRARRCAR